MISVEKGSTIGEFDLYDYGLPTTKGYLEHSLSAGGNDNPTLPKNREYLKIYGIDKNGQTIVYGYVYFTLYVNEDGLPVSHYIGSKVMEDFRGKGLGDLLMSVYLYYSYDSGFYYVESKTRQKKLDILALMQKYGFRVNNPEAYDNGESTKAYKNNMVVDIYKKNSGGLYYRFKTKKAENIYMSMQAKTLEDYSYLPSFDSTTDPSVLDDYEHIGWMVTPYGEYERTTDDNLLVYQNLEKSGFSK